MTQRKFMFPAHLIQVPSYVGDKIPGLSRVWVNTDAGEVETWFLKAPGVEKAPVILFAHGNGELIDFWGEELRLFCDNGISVMLVEYPGYGRSAGSPSQESITDVFVKAYDILSARDDVDKDRIIFMGRSIGGGAVCSLAEQRTPAGMILMSTFTNARSFAVRYLAPGLFIRDPFENLRAIEAYEGPVLVIHGDRDDLIPYNHGVKLKDAAEIGKIITYPCGHNDCPNDINLFIKDVLGFIEEYDI